MPCKILQETAMKSRQNQLHSSLKNAEEIGKHMSTATNFRRGKIIKFGREEFVRRFCLIAMHFSYVIE
jgi:hypothetical protein